MNDRGDYNRAGLLVAIGIRGAKYFKNLYEIGVSGYTDFD